MKGIRKIRGHVDVTAETHWEPRGDGVSELVIDAFRIEHRDGSVEFASTAAEALAKISANLEKSRRALERRKPGALAMWITTVSWHNCGAGFEPPTLEVRA